MHRGLLPRSNCRHAAPPALPHSGGVPPLLCPWRPSGRVARRLLCRKRWAGSRMCRSARGSSRAACQLNRLCRGATRELPHHSCCPVAPPAWQAWAGQRCRRPLARSACSSPTCPPTVSAEQQELCGCTGRHRLEWPVLRSGGSLLCDACPDRCHSKGITASAAVPFTDGQEWQVGAFRLAPDCRLPRDNLAGVRLLQVRLRDH